MTAAEVIITRATKTCEACPAQWDAYDADGRYWYLRYRHGRGSAERQPCPDTATWTDNAPEISFAHGDRLDGTMDLETFCDLAGLTLALDEPETLKLGPVWVISLTESS